MIVKGNQRAGGRALAAHLTNANDNDHVELHGLRGFASTGLTGAMLEIEAAAAGTKCIRPFFSVSLNPPAGHPVSIGQFEDAVSAIEKKYPALAGQPRAVIFHEKEGRRHAHVVWSRIDAERNKAVPLPFTRERLREVSRGLFQQMGIEVPAGLIDRGRADPLNYDLPVWQQAKRLEEDPRDLKRIIGEAWARSDNLTSFRQALEQNGMMLAQGDRRGFVVVHHSGEPLSLSRYAGIKSKDLQARLGDPVLLPTVEQVRAVIHARTTPQAAQRGAAMQARHRASLDPLNAARQRMKAEHAQKRRTQAGQQDERSKQEARTRAERLRESKGRSGDAPRQTAAGQNAAEAKAGTARDRAEREAVINAHLDERGDLQGRFKEQRGQHSAERQAHRADLAAGRIIEALTERNSTFTRGDLIRYVNRRESDPARAKAAIDAVLASPDLARLGKDSQGRARFTARDLKAVEQRMDGHAEAMQGRARHSARPAVPQGSVRLGADQKAALDHILQGPDLSCVIGFAGSGKSTMLDALRESYEQAGYRVQGMALAGVAADGLQQGAGIDSATIHSRLFQWDKGENLPTAKDILVMDEAGMIGSRLMERVLAHASKAGAKVVLVGDVEQLQAIDAGGALRAIINRAGAAEITTIRRQKEGWQQDATRDLATGQTGAALDRYEQAGMVRGYADADAAKQAIIEGWTKARQDSPADSQIILAATNDHVGDLNRMARQKMKEAGALGADHALQTSRGQQDFASGDRVYFLKNDRRMGVRNGSLATITAITGQGVTVELDGGRTLTFDASTYNQFAHGYAATIHKSQGVTVDRAHVLATAHMDRHGAYVGMTRHRSRLDVHWAQDSIRDRAALTRILSRERLKDTSLDYGDEGEERTAGNAAGRAGKGRAAGGRQDTRRPESRPEQAQAQRPDGPPPQPDSPASRSVEREKARFEQWANRSRAELQSRRHDDEIEQERGQQIERQTFDREQALAEPARRQQEAALAAIARQQQQTGVAGFIYRVSGEAAQDRARAAVITKTMADRTGRQAERRQVLNSRHETERSSLQQRYASHASGLEQRIDRARARHEREGWQAQPVKQNAKRPAEAQNGPVEAGKDFREAHSPESSEASHGATGERGGAARATDAPSPTLTVEERIARREATRAARAARDKTYENDFGRSM